MNGVKEIFNKEMARIFKDKKMIFSVFFLPVIIMVGILGIINSLSQNMADDIEEHTSIVYMMNEPESFQAFLEASQTKCDVKNVEDMDDAKEEIKNGTADLIIEFPENFEMEVSDYKEGDTVPQIKTYYNPSEEYSSSAFQEISGGILESYRQSLLSERVGSLDNIAVFHVNSDNPDMVIQDDAKAGGKALGMMLPYLITILLFAGAMGIGTDMIAGEKERGTMASLLVTPVRRKQYCSGQSLCTDGDFRNFFRHLSWGYDRCNADDVRRGNFEYPVKPETGCDAWCTARVAGIPLFRDHCAVVCVCKDNKRGEHLCDACLYGNSCCGAFDHVLHKGRRPYFLLRSGLQQFTCHERNTHTGNRHGRVWNHTGHDDRAGSTALRCDRQSI